MLTKQPPYELADQDVIVGESLRYVLRVRDLPNQERPREKLASNGPSALSISELVAILWGVGTRKEEVLAMAQRVIREYGEKTLLHETNPVRLANVLDIPEQKASQLIAGLEIGRRFFATRQDKPVFLRTAQQAFHHLKDMGLMKKEHLRGLYLNSRYQLVHDEVISIGSLTANIIHPREVFQPALEYGAVAIIIAHNHPSGSLEPTTADIDVTDQLSQAGQVMGIELLDHLIITKECFKSIKEAQNEI